MVKGLGMRHLIICLTLIACAALAGCSGGSNSSQVGSPLLRAGSAALGSVTAQRAGNDAAPTRIVVTRQLLNETSGEVMQVIPDKTGLQDFMFIIATRNDDTPGKVEVWRSSDGAHLILRNGVLVGTKGLGGDIRSADARAAIAGFDGRGGGGARLITIDRLDGSAQAVPFDCDITQLGSETLQIVDKLVSTYRVREVCSYKDTNFTNEYWVETSGGRMRKSRQWAGPLFGYIQFLRLKN